MNAAAQVVFSLGFGILYWEMASGLAGFEESAPLLGVLGTGAYLLAFFAPQALFRYTLEDSAATVLAQLSRRFALATLVVLGLNGAVAAILTQGQSNPVPVIMEVYSATFLGLIIFHALDGLVAEQGNYLQRTKQYNTNQMFAGVLGASVLFVLLCMYFLAFDLAVQREARIYVRDMIFGTQAMAGFVWFIYRLGHH